jgi:hypothetical protein
MDSEHFAKQETEAVKKILKRPSRVYSAIALFTRFLFAILLIATLVLSPCLFGYLWYNLVVHEAISSAIIGIVCGIFLDFFILLMMQ